MKVQENMWKLKIVLLLSAFSAEGVRGNCTLATFHIESYVCDYVVPSIFGLFLLSLIAHILLACKLFKTCRAQTNKGNQEIVISEVMKYSNSPNIHSIVHGPSPPKSATTIEIHPAMHEQVNTDRTIANSTTFLVDVSCEEKDSPSPLESVRESKPRNYHMKRRSGLPKPFYMSLKQFLPKSRSSPKGLCCDRPKDAENIADKPYDDTVERVTQDEYINMTQKNLGVAATNLLPSATKGENPHGVSDQETKKSRSSCQKGARTKENKDQLIRDYVNVSPSNPNDSAANCLYAFPQLRSFPEKLRALKFGKLSLSQTSHIRAQTET